MEFDKKQIMGKLESMSDEDLKNIVRAIARSAGVSERRAEQTVSDIGKLRRGVSSMSERDLQSALSCLDVDTLDEIKKQIDI